ncbi:MAG TPA: hypothetical protein VJ343_01860 [archaeon]|nr:hypothetical protein [archaeon]
MAEEKKPKDESLAGILPFASNPEALKKEAWGAIKTGAKVAAPAIAVPAESFSDKLKKIGGSLKGQSTTKICPKDGEVTPNKDGRCPFCNHSLTTKRSNLGYLASFGGFFAVIFLALNYIFGSFLTSINSWSASLGVAFPTTVMVAGISALFAGLLAMVKDLKKGMLGCLAIVLGLGIGVPMISGVPAVLGNIPGVGGIDVGCYIDKMMSGDFQNMNSCFTPPDGGGTENMPGYSGTKSYKSLEITFGAKRESGNVISAVYATEPYTMDISLSNPNTEESGVKFTDVKLFEVVMTKNGFVETKETKCGDSNHIDSSCPISLPADVCSKSNPCLIKPEEEMTAYTEFPGPGSFYLAEENSLAQENQGIPCRIYYERRVVRYERDAWGALQEIEEWSETERTLTSVSFYVNTTYVQNVTHERTLAVAASYDDMLRLDDDANLKKEVYTLDSPTPGPIDMLIDFTTPYYLGQRNPDKISLEVWVANKGQGKIEPGNITITTVGDFPTGNFPAWLAPDDQSSTWSDTGRCKFSDGVITISKFSDNFLKLKNPIKYVCDFNIYPEEYPGYSEGNPAAYQTVKFIGWMQYTYSQSAITQSQSVDRSFCD